MHIGISNYPQLKLVECGRANGAYTPKASAALATRLLSLSIRRILAILSYPLSNSLASFFLALKLLKLKTSPPPNEAGRSG